MLVPIKDSRCNNCNGINVRPSLWWKVHPYPEDRTEEITRIVEIFEGKQSNREPIETRGLSPPPPRTLIALSSEWRGFVGGNQDSFTAAIVSMLASFRRMENKTMACVEHRKHFPIRATESASSVKKVFPRYQEYRTGTRMIQKTW